MVSSPAEISGGTARRVSVAWPPFAEKLAAVLKRLKEDQFLVISAKKQPARYIQFAGQGAFGMRAETASNHYLSKSEQLDESQITSLVAAGWHEPTGRPSEATPGSDPDGSPNFYVDYAPPVPYPALAELTVRTLSKILGVPHPGYLEYEAFDANGRKATFSQLGLKRAKAPAPDERSAVLPESLLAAMRKATGLIDLEYDEDGDIGIQCGSVAAFVRLVGNHEYVRISSPLVRRIEETPALLGRLNEMNSRTSHARFFFHDGAVFAVTEIAASPFVGEHVAQTLRNFCETADGVDSLLQAEFGGATFVVESMPSSLRH